MKSMQNSHSVRALCAFRRQRGTTLLELLIAMAILLIIGGVGFNLFNGMQTANTNLQAQQGLSMTLRTATSQLQMDLANAGNGYFPPNTVQTSWPVGVTIQNNWITPGSSACYSTSTGYTNLCFDQLNIITADPTLYPPVNPTDSNGDASPAACPSTNNSPTIVYALPAAGLTLAQTMAKFSAGDYLLFLHVANNSTKMTVSILQSAPTANAALTAMVLPINQTLPNGSNTVGNDPLDITACDGNSCPPAGATNNFGINFCGSSDWIIKLSPIQYQVVGTGPNSWQLIRKQNGTTSIIMDQILGFKVGASLFDADPNDPNMPYYNYDSSSYKTYLTPSTFSPQGYNFSLIRSVRVSIIGRSATIPNYKNSFDGGAYQVMGSAVIVNPRNLSMNDN